jgi:hypothetical protein
MPERRSSNAIFIVWPDLGSNLWSTALKASTPNDCWITLQHMLLFWSSLFFHDTKIIRIGWSKYTVYEVYISHHVNHHYLYVNNSIFCYTSNQIVFNDCIWLWANYNFKKKILCRSDEKKFKNDLMNIARTTLSSKILTQYKDHFSALCVDAVLRLKVK